MKEIFINLFKSTTFWTIISGVFVYVISQYFFEIWIKPLQQYRELRKNISYELVLYANLYSNPITFDLKNKDKDLYKQYKDASLEIRKLSADLCGYIEIVPKFHLGIPSKAKLNKAVDNLVGLSNSFIIPSIEYEPEGLIYIQKRVDETKRCLKIYGYKKK